MNVVAVVVTYNRLELLKRNLSCLRRQTVSLTTLVVVDNGSTDGTGVWLDEQEDVKTIHQTNVGGAGGFYTGMEYARLADADWIWCMDDDVFPRPDCLERLLAYAGYEGVGILAPRRLLEGRIYTNDFLSFNLTHPFSSMYSGRLSKMEVNAPVEICGTAFEGLFVRSEVVKLVGLPNKDLFIFCDDTDYCLRTVMAGYKILYVPTALMDKEKFFSDDSWGERNKKKKWKRFYQIRNSSYLNHHYGKNWAVKYLRGFNGAIGYILIAFFSAPFSDAYRWTDIPMFWKAYTDGIRERLGRL